MILPSLFFYLFATVAVVAAVMVITSRNPVHSVLWLIAVFFNGAGLFLLLGAEFLALVLVVVYVGAVLVLFLFVVMMLDVDFGAMRAGVTRYLPVGLLIGGVLFVEIVIGVGAFVLAPTLAAGPVVPMPPVDEVSNVEALGQLIYTRYAFFFQAAGMVLLVAMVGAIVLTLRDREGVKRQDIAAQVARTREQSIEVRQVPFRKGL